MFVFKNRLFFQLSPFFSRNFEIFDFYPERFFRVGWFSSWVYVSKSPKIFRGIGRSVLLFIDKRWMDGLTTILGDGMETTQMNGFGDGLMDEWRPIVLFWRHSLSGQRSMNFRRRRLHRHFLETLGYSEGKAWEFGSRGISLLPSKMDNLFNQDMFTIFNVGNSWNTVVIYTLPYTVYMSICSRNSVSSSNIRTVYRYWRFSSVRGAIGILQAENVVEICNDYHTSC